ncbi:flavodoxin [Treponema vincentii]|uniref:flavodoxin domain-containing protein n=1 Tax=Treponema vincentii TaxID=69710 RepID=UPI003D921F0D
MKKAAIIYASVHHGNTEKVVTAMAHDMPVTLFKVEQAEHIDFSEYDCIGFASGIYAGRCHRSIYAFLKNHRHELPKQTFAVCTSGVGKGKYAKKFADYLAKSGFTVLGEFECKGFDTFGPLKLFGGLGKGHPDDKELADGVAFIKKIMLPS